MHLVFGALSKLKSPWQLTWLVAPSERAAAERLVHEYELQSVKIVAERSPQRWREVLSDCDVAVHLHFSVYGQVGPYLELSLAAGAAVLVSQFGATESLSSEVAWKILPGVREQAEIAAVLDRLSSERSLCRNSIAASYAREFFSPTAVAADLAIALNSARSWLREFNLMWQAFEQQAKAALVSEVLDLGHQSEGLPDPFAASFSELGFV